MLLGRPCVSVFCHCQPAMLSLWKGMSLTSDDHLPNTSVTTRISEFLVALKDHIPHCHGDQGPSQLMLAIVDSDSTSVYYNVLDGIQISNSETTVIKKAVR